MALRLRRPPDDPPPLPAVAALFVLLGLALSSLDTLAPALVVCGVGCGVLAAWLMLRG